MKKLLTILLVVCFCAPVYAGGTMYLKGTDTFMISHGVPDSAGEAYTPADSVEITVMFQDATESMAATWFNNADAQAVLSNGKLYFYDAWTDMNGSDSLGTYTVTANWYDGSGAALPFEETYTVIQVTDNIEALAKEASLFDPTTDIVIADDTMSTGDSSGTKENQTSILAYFDTLIYVGPRGPGVYLDSAAGNTNTVLGTDGTSKNPVSTIATAKTIATALGYNRYYFLNASTFNDAANDIPSSHQNWEFIGIGNSNALAFGTQRVDESRFENMDLSGAMHGSGGNVLYTNCTFGYITQNFNGHAINCWLADTIVVKAGQDIDFARCQSGVAGNRTPTIDLSGGSSVVQLRGYSGGIRIMNGASNDTISIETDGQVIISANNTSLSITLRGMMSITDSGTTTNLTKDAVFSRAEAALWVWSNADTTHPDSSDLGAWLINNLSGAASGLDTLSTAFVTRLVDEINSYAFYATKGAVGGTPGATGFRSVALTEATNDHWKDNMLAMFTGDTKGEGARITAFTPATDSITFTPAFAKVPAVGDSFFVFTLISESGSASGVDSTVLSNVLHRIAWGTPVGSGSDSSTAAQRDIGAIADRAISLATFDTASVAAYYAFGIWLDDAASNTNTTVGVDGTPANPVSTLAAARILADSMGLQKYYLINNSVLTLDATYEDWKFVGIGEGSLINFGSQDVDNSHFEHLMISGTQGGTGIVGLHGCYLNTIDSLEAIVTNSSYSDTISLRVSTNTVFDQCYSHIAGNASPGLDFNGGSTITVDVRHYSGGLTLFNGTSDHTISYESDGQLIIDASCTSINVTARGNMTITDNGTTTSLTVDGVFNRTYTADVNITSADAGSVELGDADIRYAGYLAIGTVEDSAGNTAALFQTDLSAGNDNYYNFATLVFIEGNNAGLARPIGDYTGASGAIKVAPAFVTIPAVGDSFAIVTSIAGIMPFSPESTQIKLFAGLVGPDFDQTGGGLDSIEFNDSYYHAIAVASDSGSSSAVPDSLFDKIDSILTSTGDSLNIHVGRAGSSTPTASLHMKQGAYSGAAGDDNNIKDDIAAIAIGSGSGANACTIYVKAGADFIQGVNVRLESSGGTDYYVPRTDSDGKAVFALDDGTYYGYATVTGHTQDVIPDTFTFTADYNDTLMMTPFAPSAPAGDLTTLYNWIVDGNDQGIKNVVVEAYIPNKFWPVKNTNKAIRAQHSTKTDSVGYWELQIFGNDIVLTDQGDSSSYWMVASDEGTFKHKVTVSSDSSSQLMVKDSD